MIFKTYLVVALVLGITSLRSQEPPPGGAAPQTRAFLHSDLPPGVLARVDGREISVEEYQRYLFRRTDRTQLLTLIDEVLVERKAEELGVEATDEELAEIVDRQLQSKIERVYAGDREAFRRSLSRRLQTYERHRQWQIDLERPRLLMAKCILKTRVTSETDVRTQFERMYGLGGIHVQLRHILIRTPRGDRPAKDQEASRDPRIVAEEVMTRLENNPDAFVEMVQTFSGDAMTRRNEGFIPNYRPGFYGKAFDETVRKLEREGEIAGPVESDFGYHILQLVQRNITRLEDVRDELLEELLRQPPTPEEKAAFRKKLRTEAKIEI